MARFISDVGDAIFASTKLMLIISSGFMRRRMFVRALFELSAIKQSGRTDLCGLCVVFFFFFLLRSLPSVSINVAQLTVHSVVPLPTAKHKKYRTAALLC